MLIELETSQDLLKNLMRDGLNKKNNIIIHGNKMGKIDSSTLALLKEFSVKFEHINKSFILVSSKSVNFSGVLVPTIEEAEDYLEMTKIERQLKI